MSEGVNSSARRLAVIIDSRLSGKQRIPRKVKKWVRRSAHFVRFTRKGAVITYDGWGRHFVISKSDLRDIHKPKRRK